ncbi:MAG: hypothetical protein U5K27_21185 [Desulfotignum sp.]|nr:hypothetical protein [Desulfotignum sp.]
MKSACSQIAEFYGVIAIRSTGYCRDNEIIWKTQADTDVSENPDPSGVEENHAGWFFDLPDEKERIVRDLVIRNKKVIAISSSTQTDSPGVAGGETHLMEI